MILFLQSKNVLVRYTEKLKPAVGSKLDWIVFCLKDTASLLLFGYKLDFLPVMLNRRKQVKAIKECISIPTIHRCAITAS